MALWGELRHPASALFLATLALSLVRADQQPGVEVGFGGTTATIVPADVALAALFVVVVAQLRDRRPPRVTWLGLGGGVAFCAIVVLTAAANGSGPLVAAVKLVELGVLTLAALVLVRRRRILEAVVDVLLLFTLAADAYALVEFIRGGGGRQNSFLGEHDFAALATLPLLYGLVLVSTGKRTGRAVVAIVAGAIGCTLGAALASLLGLYAGAAVLLVAVVVRRTFVLRTTLVTAVVVGLVTAGTLTIRAGDLGFLQSWFGKPASRPGQYAASWSQRLIFTYIDGRIFLARPLLGTGWYGLLPPDTWNAYLPDARRRFSDQPPWYFPPRDAEFIPQQTFDQIPAELGIVGSLAFLAFLAGAGRAAVRAARRSPLAAAWFAAMLGALAGDGFFGGTTLVALAWLVPGICLALAWSPEAAPE
jgi:hypothetical protein